LKWYLTQNLLPAGFSHIYVLLRDRPEVDAADHWPRAHEMIGNGANEIEIAVGDDLLIAGESRRRMIAAHDTSTYFGASMAAVPTKLDVVCWALSRAL
jgi:hypothetical protein